VHTSVNSKKLLLISSEFPPQPGGIGNHAYNVATYLQATHIAVTVLTDRRSKDGLDEVAFDDKQPFLVKRVVRRPFIFISYFNRIRMAFSLLRRNDVVLLSGKFSLWIGGMLSLFSSKKMIAVLHGSEVVLTNRLLRSYTNWCLHRFESTIAVSNYTKSLIPANLQKNCTVIPNGFAIVSEVVSEKEKTTPIHLITVGNVTERKGQQNIIKALPLLLQRFPELTYHIVGIPTEKERLIALAKSLNVLEAVVFHGMVTEADKIMLLQKSSIFVMLSEATSGGDVEGFGIAILEANALGVPAIGAKGCGIEDAIDDQFSGVLIDGNKPEELAQGMEEVLNSYSSYSKNAISWSKKFKWDEIIREYLKIIKMN